MTELLINQDWQDIIFNYQRIYVGYSGGLDSSVLLHHLLQLPELKSKLTAVHVNHGLSSHATEWQNLCEDFCKQCSLPLIIKNIVIEGQDNLEEKARKLRYDLFSALLKEQECILLGHHEDDQLETFLLHLFRGTGIDGLCAMPAIKPLGKGKVLRPLLKYSRQQLEDYASHYHLQWAEDESNQNLHFSRNYVRHSIVPLIKQRWPNVLENVSTCISHLQDVEKNLKQLANQDAPEIADSKNQLNLTPLYQLPKERIGNVLRIWLKKNQIRLRSTKILNKIIDEVIFASQDACPEVKWGKILIRRYQQTLFVLVDNPKINLEEKYWEHFPTPLKLMTGEELKALPSKEGIKINATDMLQIRFRTGGETFYWHGKTKALKKLLQEWNVPYWLRDQIPLLYINNELAMVIGYAISDHYFSKEGEVYTIARL